MIAVVALSTNADAGARVPGDATCNGIVNESDLLPALEEFAGIGEGAAGCPENVNVICTDPLDFRDLLALLSLLADIDPGVTFCVATPTPGPTGTPSTATMTPTATPQGTPGTATPGSGTPGTVTPGTTATPGPSVTPTVTPAATPTPSPSPSPTPQICDQPLLSGSLNALDAAKAIGLCSGVAAAWVMPDGGTTLPAGGQGTNYHRGHSIRPQFGSNVFPQEGNRFLILSSGSAADPSHTTPSFFDPETGLVKGYTSPYPNMLPQTDPGCPQPAGTSANDGIGLQLTLTAPANATGFSFDWKYYTVDYPRYVCSEFIDFAAVMVNNTPLEYINVNNPAVDQCESGQTGQNGQVQGNRTCVGTSELAGTGYNLHPSAVQPDEGAATSWMTVSSPATAGQQYIIVFTVWDTSDGQYDSAALFDNFHWTYD